MDPVNYRLNRNLLGPLAKMCTRKNEMRLQVHYRISEHYDQLPEHLQGIIYFMTCKEYNGRQKCISLNNHQPLRCELGQQSQYSNLLQAGQSGDLIPLQEKFSPPNQTSCGAYPISIIIGTGSFLGGKVASMCL